MSLPSATVLGAMSLGAVGAVLAAGAALSAPHPSPRSDQQPLVVTTTSPLPCPAGTEEHGDSCLKVVVAPAAPAPVAPARETAASDAGSSSTGERSSQQAPEVEPTEPAETPDSPDAQEGQHDQPGGDGQHTEDAQDSSHDGSESGD